MILLISNQEQKLSVCTYVEVVSSSAKLLLFHFKAEKFDSKMCIKVNISSMQVKSGTIFDNFLITNDPKLAEEVGNETWGKTKVSPKLWSSGFKNSCWLIKRGKCIVFM